MSGEASTRRPYAGRGIAELRGPKSRIRLPTAETVTLLPDPRAAHADWLARIRAVNGPKDAPTAFPTMTARDVRSFANLMTLSLRNDLPSLDPRDAAVLWEKWRQAVAEVRDHLRNVRDEDATNATADGVWGATVVLDHRGWDVVNNLALALSNPGAAFDAYCPWRTDWATFERLHPEAV